MGNIGGNKDAVIQVKRVVQDDIGARNTEYADAVKDIKGWLELKYQENGKPEIRITPENSRMTVDGEIYEVMLYDDPMGMHEHLEIYLKYTGGR